MHLARGRKVRLACVRDIGRLTRRRRVGRKRPVRAHGSRGRTRADVAPDGVRARQAERQIAKTRPCFEPARHEGALPARSGDLRSKGAFQAGTCLQDGSLEGLPIRRRRDPLVLRQGLIARSAGRPGESDLPFRRRAQGVPLYGYQWGRPRTPRHFHGQRGQGRRARSSAMGGRLDRR